MAPSRNIVQPNSLNETLANMSQSNGAKVEKKVEKAEPSARAMSQSSSLDASGRSKPGVTYAAQDRLPKLPIPDLESSCKKYISALEPLQSRREHQDTKAAVADFLRAEGPELHDRLKKYATGKSSYIEQFWYDSYLNYDSPVVLNLNPFFLLEDDPTPARNDQVTRAASLVISALAFVRALRKEELPPDMLRNQPLDMYQYSRLFATARIPTDNGCQIAQDQGSQHIVVLCRGQFYWFDVLDSNSDLIMTEADVAQNLEAVVKDAHETSIFDAAKSAVGVLSTENRKIWSGLRDVLSRDEGSNNADCLDIVDSALFILCLDDTEPRSGADLCMNMLCGTSEVERGVQIGTCTNRWYDKLQIIVCGNGSAGINFEHTGVDGHTVLRFASDVYTDTILRYARSINGQAPSLWASSSPDPTKRDPKSFGPVSTIPHKLEWNMIPEVSTALRFAETRLADLIQQNEFATLEFAQYGSNFMKSMGFSPDAFVQMAYQAAYYGLYGRVECTYEPAMTKMFYHGRTEAIRPVTMASLDFVRTFWAENPAAVKVDALRKACEQHTAITKDCSKGQGQDRHLYAMFCLWSRQVDEEADQRNGLLDGDSPSRPQSPSSPTRSNRDSMLSDADGSLSVSISGSGPGSDAESAVGTRPQAAPQLPALFSDNGWDKLNTTILSTSNCGNPSLRQFGFGPTSAEGFGIGYIIKDHSVSICASSKHRQTKRFVDAIEAYFLEIRKLLRQIKRRGTSSDKTMSRVREAEQDDTTAAGRLKSRGRAIGDAKQTKAPAQGITTEEEDDDELGGYGFFDAGMLLQAIKSGEEEEQRRNEPAVRRSVGKKLRLMEY